MAPLTLDTSVRGAATLVALRGELDLAGAAVLDQALGRIDGHDVVLDLRGLTFIDSSGLRSIAVAARRAGDAGRGFALVEGTADVMRVFDITRMRERLTFVEAE
jgi:anti-sigma B factor antagonist